MYRAKSIGVPALLAFGLGSLLLGLSLRLEGRGSLDAGLESGVVDLGAVPTGGRVPLSFSLVNPTPRTVRVLGATSQCFAHGCLEATGIPQQIPALGTGLVEVELRPVTAGDFAGELVLYTDAPGRPETRLKVRGRILGDP
jgi:hypothetical protein